MPGIAGTYGVAGWGGRPVDGTDGWSARGEYRVSPPAGNPFDGHVPVGNHVYHADMEGQYGDTELYLEHCGGVLDKNRWYSVEQYIQLNTPGQNDGIIRAYGAPRPRAVHRQRRGVARVHRPDGMSLAMQTQTRKLRAVPRAAMMMAMLVTFVQCTTEPAADESSGSDDGIGSVGNTDFSSTAEAEGSTRGTGSTAGPDSTGSEPIFDVGAEVETEGSTECGCGSTDFSYLWAANAPESTVSKINTRTMVEEGRYPTHPDGDGNPSRTSVSVDGRAVVVQNRDKPGLVKIWARPEFCDPTRNGMPGLQTSTGAGDVLAFEDDDCFAWWTPFPDMTVQRPVAWTQGQLNADCEYEDQKIWTVTGDQGSLGECGTDGVWVHRLDGDTGVVEESIHLLEDEFACNNNRGAYGGAVDNEGNFWFSGWQNSRLARVDFETLAVTVVDVPGSNAYGITVDTQGRPWLTWPVRRYDPLMDVWDEVPLDASTGIAEDNLGRMWVSDGDDLVWIDRDTMAIGDTIDLPAGDGTIPRGIAVDVDGMVWAVRRLSNLAYRVDPADSTLTEFDTLNGAYTYSDMTGGQLQNVTCNPPG